MVEEGLALIVAFLVAVAIFMNRNISEKIDRGWIVSVWRMILFLVFCMATGVFGSYFVTKVLIRYSSVSESVLNIEYYVLGFLVIFLCLTSYRVLYHPVFAEWHQIIKKTTSEDTIKKLKDIVERLNNDVNGLLEETQPGILTKEMTEKIQNLAAFEARLDRLERNQRNLSATRILNILLLVFSIVTPIVLEISENIGG